MEHRQRLSRSTNTRSTPAAEARRNKSTLSLSKKERRYVNRYGTVAVAGGEWGLMESLIRNLALLLALSLVIGNLRSWRPAVEPSQPPKDPSLPLSLTEDITNLKKNDTDGTSFIPPEPPTIEHNDSATKDSSNNNAKASQTEEEEQMYHHEIEISGNLLEDKLLELIQRALDASSYQDTETILTLSNLYFTKDMEDNDEDGGAELILSAYRGSSIFYDLTTPQGKAFQWLLKDDTYLHNYHKTYFSTFWSGADGGGTRGGGGGAKHSPPEADVINYPTLLQRYILVVFFFATEGHINYKYNSPATSLPSQNVPILWTAHGSLHFLDNLHECQWYDSWHGIWMGVKACSSPTSGTATSFWNWSQTKPEEGESMEQQEDEKLNQVTQLFLPELGLEGSVPVELGLLTKLQTLDLQSNYLEGVVPVSIGSLTDLRSLCKFKRLISYSNISYDTHFLHLW